MSWQVNTHISTMKKITLSLFSLVLLTACGGSATDNKPHDSATGFSNASPQLPVYQKPEVVSFWNEMKKAVATHDTDAFLQHVAFPLDGAWYTVVEMKEPMADYDDAHFKHAFDDLITERLTDSILAGHYTMNELTSESGTVTGFEVLFNFEDYDKDIDFKFESSITWQFRLVDGHFKMILFDTKGC